MTPIYSLLLLLLFSPLSHAIDQIKMRPVFYDGDPKTNYKYQLVERLLKATEAKYGPYEIIYTKTATPPKRDIKQLSSGNINVFISMTSHAREAAMQAIRYPVFKGLYGYRVFLIREADQGKFSSINTLEELKALTAIQGIHWPDLDILKANNFNVESTSQHTSLYKMLSFGRVDYFPRGIHEPWQELETRPNMGLAVEKSLMLYYPAPGYIFVDKNNTRLANRFTEGFETLLASGEFDQFFNQHPQIVEMKKQANLEKRLIFKLTNPLLPSMTPLEDERLWFKITP